MALPEDWLPVGDTQTMNEIDEVFRQQLTRAAGYASHYRQALRNAGIEENLADHMTAEWANVFWTMFFAENLDPGAEPDEPNKGDEDNEHDDDSA